MPQLLTHSSVRTTAIRTVKRALYKLSVQKDEDNLSATHRIACFPRELIGREVALTGVYEGDILDAAFDNLLSDHAARFMKTTCLDIGANIGNHTCYFSRRFKSVFAFEPNPVCFNLLKCNINLNAQNASAYEFGLSDRDAKLKFFENQTNLGGSGFAGHDEPVGTTRSDKTVVEKYLSVRKGDEFIGENLNGCEISFIKVDVEGHELPVLKGLQNNLIKFRPILAVEMYSSRQDGRELMSYLRSIGYEKFISITKSSGNGRLRDLISRAKSRVYAAELGPSYTGDHDFVIVS